MTRIGPSNPTCVILVISPHVCKRKLCDPSVAPHAARQLEASDLESFGSLTPSHATNAPRLHFQQRTPATCYRVAVMVTELETARRWARECETAVRWQCALTRKLGSGHRLAHEAKAQLMDQQEILRLQQAYLAYTTAIYAPVDGNPIQP